MDLLYAIAALAGFVLYVMHFVWMSRIAADVRRLADAGESRAVGRVPEQALTWACPKCTATSPLSSFTCSACKYSLR